MKALEPSSCAPAAVGPKARIPTCRAAARAGSDGARGVAVRRPGARRAAVFAVAGAANGGAPGRCSRRSTPQIQGGAQQGGWCRISDGGAVRRRGVNASMVG